MTSPNGGSKVNLAFDKALQIHLDRWKSDKRSFPDSATPDSLYSEIKEHENRYLKTKVYSYTSRLSSLIDRFQGFFSLVDTFVSSSSSIAALVWGGIRFIIRTASEYSKYFKRIMDVLEQMSQKLYFYHRYATVIYKKSDRVMMTLADVYGDILDVFMTVKKTFITSENHIRSSPAIAIQAFRFWSTFEEVIKSLDRRHVTLIAEVEHTDREANHADREEHILDKLRNDMDRLQRLLRFDGSECGEKHRQSQDKVFPSSGAWLLEQPQYQGWRDSRSAESRQLFWLHGQLGSGKTVLTSIVIEDLKRHKRPGSLLAIFYCDYKFDEKTRTDCLLRSLLGQLLHWFEPSLSQAPPVVHEILAEFSTARAVIEIPLADVLTRLTKHCGDVVMVIDALDECQDRKHILPFLHQLPSSARLFVASRDEDDIRHSFVSHFELSEQVIMPEDVKSDIRDYIVRITDDHLLQYPSFIQDRSLIQTIVETLVEKANGMFLWVFFQVKNILECDTDNDVRETLRNLPKGLEETYIRCLTRIDQHSSKDRLRRILRLVVCFDYIKVDDLLELINVDEMGHYWESERTINDVSTLVSRCGHLICRTEDGLGRPCFAPLHFSVYDFLISNPQSFDFAIRTLPQYHCYPLFDAYMSLARTFGRSYCINGCPELWHVQAAAIRQWQRHLDLVPRTAEFLTTMFDAPLVEDIQPSPVFPNATHVTLTNCRFFEVLDEYYILTPPVVKIPRQLVSTKLRRGPYLWTDVFPQPSINCTIKGSRRATTMRADCGIHVQPDAKPSRNRNANDLFAIDGTRVTVVDVDFIWAKSSNWTIRPCVEIVRNKTTSTPMETVGKFIADTTVTYKAITSILEAERNGSYFRVDSDFGLELHSSYTT
ncbi:hypothetical protein GALMADRAFT_279192 [Galerina marginata CBS 339.88]|uniref:NACHT domain-containing protein n=1 Tax=Galerina marginata (strain CBS 339.88) TaxID=685588 RepID=A0A067T097_GALM3|nr:hypothetical protein GALMADRAFT_279192 [Galerina marginata CBS 339.88]